MRALQVVTIVGARPQFIKAAALSRAFENINEAGPGLLVEEVLVHTGQHYDFEMSDVFFAELSLPKPGHSLGVGSGPHGRQTAEMMIRLEPILEERRPDVVLVYGDTNSTLAGALVAAKMGLPLAHVEAGLRAYRRDMPEEINRVVTDRLSTHLFCPSVGAVENLAREGITDGVEMVGDVMHDVLLWGLQAAERAPFDFGRIGLTAGQYGLATLHRAENIDQPSRLIALLAALSLLADEGLPIVLPAHPRLRQAMSLSDGISGRITIIPPVSYVEMLQLESNAQVVLTDSGGVQKEAYWLGTPCVTLRDETEWVETLDQGWNVLAGIGADRITAAARRLEPSGARSPLYGVGDAAETISRSLYTALESQTSGNARPAGP